MLFEFGGLFRKVWRAALILGAFVIGANTVFVAPVSAATGINQQLNFQGRLLNAQGAVAQDGYYNVEFKIYQDGTGDTAGNPGGTLKWTEDWLNSGGNPVRVVNGYISVQLGSINPFGNSVDWNQDTIWLSVNIGNTSNCTITTNFTANCGGDGEMLPMKRLSAVPYALNSARLGGLTAAGFIQNTTTVQAATNMAIDGTARADTSILTPLVDTNTAVALNIGTTNATSINLNQNVTVAAGKSLTLAGGNTASRPASPTEGMLYYDTSTKQLLVYSNGKWQADRDSSTKIVAASNASQALKDGADYVASGTGDQTQINDALTAAAGGKVYLTEGTFTINGPIQVRNNTTLSGAGPGTVITVPNAQNGSYYMVTNFDTSTGTNIAIRDLKIDGNKANQTSGATAGIYFDHMGGGSGTSARTGGTITNVTVTNTYGSSGIILSLSNQNTVTNTTVLGAGGSGIRLANSPYNTLTNNFLQGNSTAGIYLDTNSYRNTISNNSIQTNSFAGIYLYNSNENVVTSNNISDSGTNTNNNALYVAGTSARTSLTNNIVMDGNASTTNYPINIASTAESTLVSNNLFSSTPGTSSINDASGTTTYSNQSRTENGAKLTNRTANDAEAFVVQNAAGSNIFAVDTSGNQVVIGNSSTVGKINLSDGSSNTLTLSVAALAGNYTLSIPTITANDTVCLQALANCGTTLTVGALDGGTANANGMTISGSNVYLQSASETYAGLVNTGTQTFAGAKTFNDSITLASAKTINLTGSTTANRPASPTEGMIYYDTDTKQLLVYANGKWQADRNASTKIVAASNSSQAAKDGADFVATGTNDHTIINTALTAAAGGHVYLTEGTFTTAGAISIPNNTTLAGAGRGTLIQFANIAGQTQNMIVNSNTTTGEGVVIRDMRLDGNRAVNTTGTMHGINLTGIGSGSSSTARQGPSVLNVWVMNFLNNGIFFNSASNGYIVNSTVQGNGGNGIDADSSNRVNISNNVILGNAAWGVHLSGTLAIVVNANSIAGNGTLTGSNVGGGVLFDGTGTNNAITNNTFRDNTASTANSTILITNSSYNSITGNSLYDSAGTGHAIWTTVSATGNYFADNTMSGAGPTTINDLGTGTVFGGQVNSAGNFLIQPAGTVELLKNTNVTGTLSATTSVLAPSIDRATAGTLTIGTNATNTTAISIGSAAVTTTIAGNTGVTLNATTGTTMVCRNATGLLSTCDATYFAPTATNFIQNGTALQASSNFHISGTGQADTSVLTPTLDTATGVVLNIGTTTATGITIGKSTIATSLRSSTINVGTSGSTTNILGAAQTTSGQAGNAMVIQGSTGLNGNGGAVTVQGGNANGTGTLGGNLTLAGGTGSTSNGLVILGTSAFNTNSTDTGCYPSGADSTSTTNCNIAQSSVNNYASVIVGFTNDGQTAFMPNPSILTAGRVVYVTASSTTKDFTLSVNGGGQGNQIAMRKNTTATMIWNGTAWTAAGASSSTTLQAAYDNTLQSAGGAELVVSKTNATNGLTIRDSSTNSVNGALLTVQSSSAANLFSVNSNVTEYTSNSGAEAYSGSTSTFPASTWVSLTGSTVARNVTTTNIATGQGSAQVTTSTTAGSGIKNVLATSLTPGQHYNVSFSAKLASGTFTDLGVYYSINGTTDSVTCTTNQAIKTSVWTKVNCTFTAPTSGITSTNSINIRQINSGTIRTFYVDNISVTIAADYNYATDGDVDDAANFATNWPYTTGIGSGSTTRNGSDGFNASSSAGVTITAGAANAGLRNKLSINPLASTLYRVSVYAKSSNAFNDFKIRYSPNGGTTYVDCSDYNTQTLSTSAWTQITCYVTTGATAVSNPYVYFVETASAARTFYVDAFSMTLASSSTPNVQIGSGSNGGPTTLFTLDKGASAPIAANNDALLGSMYYDTTLGKLQCYEADGWGACGSSPDNIVTISPEYTNAVMHGTGVGTMTSDICSDALDINDGTSGQSTICGTNETYNLYKWTSPQATPQTYSIYVTYQLPATFKEFSSGQTSVMGRTDNANSTVQYQIYRSNSSTGMTPCGSAVTVSTGAQTSWQPGQATGAADPSTCSFTAGDSIVFKISMTSSSNANAYIGNLGFTFSNR